MLFTLRNLGRLEEATIDLGKDLIVLTGPNNTSKTYVAHAIYGFCDFLVTSLRVGVWDTLKQEKLTYIELDLLSTVERDLAEICRRGAAGGVSLLPVVLGAPQSFIESTQIDVRLLDHEIEEGRSRILAQEAREWELDGEILIEKHSNSGTWTATRTAQVAGTRSSEEQTGQALRNFLVLNIVSAFVGALFNGLTNPHIIPAERSAVEIFSRELAAKRFDAHEQDKPPPTYPLALAESLKEAQLRVSWQNATSPYAAEADRLEREILGGRLEIGPLGESVFQPAGTTERLNMNLSSSSVKSLAGLSFWLRHLAQKGDFLIIDEPELNLHPHNQRLVARLSRSGIKVMISTHSDYIVRELNNLIMLSRDKDGKLREKHGYGGDEILDPERVGAYAFDGAHGRPIAIGLAGIKVETFDKDIKDLNRSASDIYFTLDEQGDDEA